jgi:hypothetical protein
MIGKFESIRIKPIKWAVFISSILSTFLVCKEYLLSSRLPGDSFDARATLTVYEHWYSIFTGETTFSNLNAFYPVPNMLGGSDANMIQGVIYSICRFIGLSLTESLRFTIVTIIFIGFLGVYRLSYSIFVSNAKSISAGLLIVTIYQLASQSGHLQTWMYPWVSWVVLSLIWIYQGRNLPIAYSILLIGIPALALSTWYTAFSITFFSLFFLISVLYLDHANSKCKLAAVAVAFHASFKRHSKFYVLIISFSLLEVLLFALIYFPKTRNNNFGNWSEVHFYSPRLYDILNASMSSQGWQLSLYNKVHLDIYPTFERAMGFSLSTCFIILVAVVIKLFRRSHTDIFSKSLIFTSVSIILLTLADERGQSLWYFANKLPIFNTIRAPGRLWIFSVAIITIVCLKIIYNALDSFKSEHFSQLIVIVMSLILTVIQFRAPVANWNSEDLLSPFGKRVVIDVEKNNCESIYLATERKFGIGESVERQIDGMVIGSITSTNSINGYTSSPPTNWPQNPVWGLVSVSEIEEWIRINPGKFAGTTCFIDESGFTLLNNR